MVVILAWNLSGRDLRIFLTILGFAIEIEGRIHNILEFSIEPIKGLILLHPYFFKTTSDSLKLNGLHCLGTFIGGLKNSPCFLSNFHRWYFLEFLIGYTTKESIQSPTVEICCFDLCFILIHWCFLWLNPTNFNSLPYFFIKSLQKSFHKNFPIRTVSTIKQRRNQKRLSTIHDNGGQGSHLGN